MTRKLTLFVILIVFWVCLYLLLSGGESASLSYFFFASANPSSQPLPEPWAKQKAQVLLFSQSELTTLQAPPAPEPQGPCANEYQVQSGDTLTSIASYCGVTVDEIQSRNPDLLNPHQIYPGQKLALYTALEKAAPSSGGLLREGAQPGEALEVQVVGLPAHARVRVGIGLTASGYRQLLEGQTGADGKLSTRLLTPTNAIPGDQAFVMVTVDGVPSIQAVSETFVITAK